MKRFLVVLVIGILVALAVVLLISIGGSKDQNVTPVTQGSRLLIPQDTDPSKGPRDAKITVIVMSSFNCPACKTSATQMDQLRALYPDQVRIVWKDLPDATGDPYDAAIAARCAQQQGKFWQFHDILFSKQDLIDSPILYSLWAKELGILTTRFDTCVEQQQTKELVDANIGEGLQHGVQIVPYVQIGDAVYEGPQTLSFYRSAIDQALAAMK